MALALLAIFAIAFVVTGSGMLDSPTHYLGYDD